MSRIVYAKDEDIDLSYEVINDCLFVHVVFERFNKAILSKTRIAWERMLIDAYFDGWEQVFTYTKDPRIINLIGGATEMFDDKLNEINMRMFKWDLTQSVLE